MKSIHIPAAAAALILSLAAGSLAQAQSGPTPQEQMACRSDAGNFCAEHIGKPPQMNACLRANKEKLSDGCRKVVECTAASAPSGNSRCLLSVGTTRGIARRSGSIKAGAR